VVRDEVEQHADTQLMGFLDERIEDLEVAEPRIDLAVIRDVVAVVGERRDEER